MSQHPNYSNIIVKSLEQLIQQKEKLQEKCDKAAIPFGNVSMFLNKSSLCCQLSHLYFHSSQVLLLKGELNLATLQDSIVATSRSQWAKMFFRSRYMSKVAPPCNDWQSHCYRTPSKLLNNLLIKSLINLHSPVTNPDPDVAISGVKIAINVQGTQSRERIQDFNFRGREENIFISVSKSRASR